MKKRYWLGLLAIILVGAAAATYVLCSSASAVYLKDGYYISRYAKISPGEWEKLDYQYNRFESVEDFLLEVDYYVEAISEYLGVTTYFQEHPGDEDIRHKIMFMSTDGTNESRGWLIYLNNQQFKQNDAPIAHEVTHFLTPFISRTLSEGLAQLMQCQFGRNASGADRVHWYSRTHVMGTGKDENIIKQIGMPRGNYPTDSFARQKYYTLSHSFVKYLVDEFGIDKFMAVYQAENILSKYEEVYGFNLEQLRAKWIDYVAGLN